ncbi:MAG: purine-binding chemotaxis protein CheW [Spirochaetes bacterium]|nr:purine-binding chemotaxis protein CheW [Spirochaetota bacterium]
MSIRTRNESKNRKSVNTEKKARTYVTLSIGNELYAIDVMKVNTVSGLCEIRPVPNSKDFMKGVITVQDMIVPVIDMRKRFNLADTGVTKRTSIAIVSVKNRLIGLLVDAVSDVMDLEEMSVQDTPHFNNEIDEDCIEGISRVNDRLVVILNTDKIVSIDEIEKLSSEIND